MRACTCTGVSNYLYANAWLAALGGSVRQGGCAGAAWGPACVFTCASRALCPGAWLVSGPASRGPWDVSFASSTPPMAGAHAGSTGSARTCTPAHGKPSMPAALFVAWAPSAALCEARFHTPNLLPYAAAVEQAHHALLQVPVVRAGGRAVFVCARAMEGHGVLREPRHTRWAPVASAADGLARGQVCKGAQLL